MTKKIIIDTNVLISVFIFEGVPNDLLKYLSDRPEDYILIISTEIIQEIEQKFLAGRVIHIMQKIGKEFDLGLVSNFVKEYIGINLLYISKSQNRHKSRDTKDNMVIDLALSAKVDYIITGDKDLLTMDPINNIRIVKPAEFLDMVNDLQNHS